jgi:hypothetical protein
MLNWIMENFATIAVLAVLVVIITLIIVLMVRDKKKGKPSCGCNCAGCAMSAGCHHGNDLLKDAGSCEFPIKIKKREDV